VSTPQEIPTDDRSTESAGSAVREWTESIQPHGTLVAVSADLVITHASRNSAEVLGSEAHEIVGRGLDTVVDASWITANKDLLRGPVRGVRSAEATIAGRVFDVIIHHDRESTILEFEPAANGPETRAVLALYQAVHDLTQATDEQRLWGAAARALLRLTDFDRVLIYRLHPDGHGEIVAEETSEGSEPFLGLHFPDTDFPSGMRNAYVGQRSRMIVSGTAESSVLISSSGVDGEARALNLDRAELRGVSPHDLHFMRSLGQASILSLSLVHNKELIGVITLTSTSGLVVPFSIRNGLEAIANQVALQQGTMTEIRRLTESMRLRAIRIQLMNQLVFERAADPAAVTGAFLFNRLTLLDLIPADGVMIALGSHHASLGTTPPLSAVRTAVTLQRNVQTGDVLSTANLAAEHPELASLLPSVSGLIVAPLPGFDGFIAWFRASTPRSLNWFGETPAGKMHHGPPSEASYPSWTESIADTAEDWTGLDSEATELAKDLIIAMLRQAETQLAALALRDSLTGLVNRRLLMDRIELSLAPGSGTGQVTLLFVDLDSFKAVNDTYGHDVGDAVLIEVAHRILSATRDTDTAARLGGDEFVILCTDSTPMGPVRIANRILESIRQPIAVGEGTIRITASIGLAHAGGAGPAAGLLRTADRAMYQAKAAGGDRVTP
jgi:chemotaxis family two-component system sensor kinase Cph1